jgi:hypothetical protein
MIRFLIGLLTIFCDTTMILCACCKKVTVEAASHKQCLQPLLCNVRIFNYELSTNSNCLACSQHTSAMLNCEPSQHATKIVITYEMVAVDVSWFLTFGEARPLFVCKQRSGKRGNSSTLHNILRADGEEDLSEVWSRLEARAGWHNNSDLNDLGENWTTICRRFGFLYFC